VQFELLLVINMKIEFCFFLACELTGRVLASSSWRKGLAEGSSHMSIKKLWKYCSLFVTLPGRFGGGTTGGWTVTLLGSRMDSSPGEGGIKVCVTKRALVCI